MCHNAFTTAKSHAEMFCVGWLCAAGLCVIVASTSRADAPAADGSISFARDVAPIFIQRCQACHGKDKSEGDYRLDTFAGLSASGASGEAIVVAGSPDESRLYQLLASDDESERMPMDGEPIPGEELALVRRWISEGGKYDGPDPQQPLSAIIPLRTHPAAPQVYPAALPITALAFSPDGTRLAVSGYYEVTLWSVADGTLATRVGNVAERTYDLAFSPDGAVLAVASGIPGELGEVRLYRTADGSVQRDLVAMADVALGVAFSPAGDRIATCGADRSIRVFDVASGAEQVMIEEHADWVHDVAWNADATRLVSASRDGTSKVFDSASGDSLATFSGHGEPVYAAVFSGDSTKIFSAGADAHIRVWNPADGKQQAEIAGFGADVLALKISGAYLVSGSADGTVRQFNVGDHAAVRNLEAPAEHGNIDWVQTIAVHEPGGIVAGGNQDGTVQLWRLDDGTPTVGFTASPGISGAE
ncbi:MAG: hypothetical protein KDA63_02255 [Planctomycetales bacterium]|nr:hypothetical protein [Planctomycetales bacterium]